MATTHYGRTEERNLASPWGDTAFLPSPLLLAVSLGALGRHRHLCALKQGPAKRTGDSLTAFMPLLNTPGKGKSGGLHSCHHTSSWHSKLAVSKGSKQEGKIVFQYFLSFFFLSSQQNYSFSQGESEKHNVLFVFIRPREIPLASMAGELVRIQERTMASWAFWSIRCLGEHSRDCQRGNGRDGVYHQLEL